MKLKRPISLPVLMGLVFVLGVSAAIAGVYLQFGLAPALIIGGAVAATFGFLVDV